jgi:hypothetical protein
MNIERFQKRIGLYVLLPSVLLYVGLRFYAQFRHVDVYVGRMAPMPAELAAGLHMADHRINSNVRIDSPYDSASETILSPQEIRRLRRALAWSRATPPLIDSLIILSPTNVEARRITKRFMSEYQLVKHEDRWIIKSAKRTGVQHFPTE